MNIKTSPLVLTIEGRVIPTLRLIRTKTYEEMHKKAQSSGWSAQQWGKCITEAAKELR